MFASLYFKFQHDKPHTFRVLTFLPLKAILLRNPFLSTFITL